MCWNTYFLIVLFEHQPKFGKTMGKKNDNFSHFPKHRFIKKPFCCNSPFDQKLVFFQLCFLKPKTLMLNKEHNLKSGKSKDKKKGLERKSKIVNQKKEKIFQEKKLQLNMFMLFFSWNKTKEEWKMKKRQKQETKRKPKERQEGRKKDKRKRETGKEKQKKGEAKKG